MAHHDEQEAAAKHVGSGTGKNDEPIGYCMLSLNEMVRGQCCIVQQQHVYLLFCVVLCCYTGASFTVASNDDGLTPRIQLEKTQRGEGVALIHPKGKQKACGTIFIRLKAIPRLSEDEIASNLQVCSPRHNHFCARACDSIFSRYARMSLKQCRCSLLKLLLTLLPMPPPAKRKSCRKQVPLFFFPRLYYFGCFWTMGYLTQPKQLLARSMRTMQQYWP